MATDRAGAAAGREKGNPAQVTGHPPPEPRDVGNQDQGTPESVDHRGYGRQEVDHIAQDRGEPGRGVVGDVEGDADGHREGHEEGQAGDQNRTEDQRAHILPEAGCPPPAQGFDGLGALPPVPDEGREGLENQEEGHSSQGQEDEDSGPPGAESEDPVCPRARMGATLRLSGRVPVRGPAAGPCLLRHRRFFHCLVHVRHQSTSIVSTDAMTMARTASLSSALPALAAACRCPSALTTYVSQALANLALDRSWSCL